MANITDQNPQPAVDSERARQIAAGGFVNRDRDRFMVTVPKRLGGPASYEVKRDDSGFIRCDCEPFTLAADPDFRCEHIVAVRFAVLARNTEPAARRNRPAADGDPLAGAEPDGPAKRPNNILRFAGTQIGDAVREESAPPATEPALPVSGGQVYAPDERKKVADILDELVPGWSYAVRSVNQGGDLVSVIASITVGAVTRESVGIGFGSAGQSVRAAECDAFVRAAAMFREVRDRLYGPDRPVQRAFANKTIEFPAEPVARSISDLVSGRQLGMIRGLCRELGLDQESECRGAMHCSVAELSKRAASAFIDYLQARRGAETDYSESEIRRAG